MAGKKLEGAESQRLEEDALRQANWKRWGPYLSERQWATVREDYSPDGQSWTHFPHDHARSRAYRWGEDGLLGITDRECRLCFAAGPLEHPGPHPQGTSLRPDRPRGKPRRGREGVLLSTSTPPRRIPTCRRFTSIPQGRFPYDSLVEENRRRSRQEPEYRTGRHRRLRRPPLFRRVGGICQGGAQRHADPRSRPPTAGRRRPSCMCFPRSGSATRGSGAVRTRAAG